MRLAVDGPWIPFDAEQRFEGTGLDFAWRAHARIARLLPVTVVDAFAGGRGALTVRAFGLVPLMRAASTPDLDRGEVLRALAELPWHPGAYAAPPPGLSFAEVGPSTLRATFDDGRTRAAVDLELGDDGRVLRASAPDRPYAERGRAAVPTPWGGAFSDWVTFGALRVPTRAEVAWHLPAGPFVYWRGQILDVRLDV